MCKSCKEKIHQQLKSAHDHEIVCISDISKENFPQKEVASEVITSVFNSYTAAVPVINSLLCSSDDLVYFVYHAVPENAQLVKGKMLKSSIRTLQTLEKRIFDIALNREGEIISNEMVDNNVCILTSSVEIKTVLDTSPLMPLYLHVDKDNELIVGLRTRGPVFPITDFSVRQVIIFDSDFKRKVVLETDKKGGKLFSYPGRIKTDSNNVLYIADRKSADGCGRIVAVDRNGRLKFTYNGNPVLDKFIPHRIAITPSNKTILSDERNNALHLLNTRGKLLALNFLDKDHYIERSCSLCIDNEGYLLIGNGQFRDNRDSNANIYVTKIIEHLM